MKTLVVLDEDLVRYLLMCAQESPVPGHTALRGEAIRQLQASLDMLAMARAAAPK